MRDYDDSGTGHLDVSSRYGTTAPERDGGSGTLYRCYYLELGSGCLMSKGGRGETLADGETDLVEIGRRGARVPDHGKTGRRIGQR
ncbi:hypothetical protein GMSM_27780 [Geomonas sp. Red276]